LFDLEEVIKEGFVHPGFAGRTSIKKVLPVIAPELSYDGLHVANGDDAAGSFALMYVGEISSEKHADLLQSLLQYCQMDTLAMVRIHSRLKEIRTIAR
jgi:hypothetical protein